MNCAGLEHGIDGGLERARVQRHDDPAVKADPFHDLEDPPPGHQRDRLQPVQIVSLGPLLPAEDQHIAKPGRGNERGSSTAAFDHRVGGHRGRMQHRPDLARPIGALAT